MEERDDGAAEHCDSGENLLTDTFWSCESDVLVEEKEGGESKPRKKAHQVQTIEPGHQEKKKTQKNPKKTKKIWT